MLVLTVNAPGSAASQRLPRPSQPVRCVTIQCVPPSTGQLVEEPRDHGRAVSAEKRDSADDTLLRLPAWERLRPHVHELPPQRFVAPLRRLQHLRVQRVELVLHAAERRPRAALQRGIDRRHGLDHRLHAGVDLLAGLPDRAFDRRGKQRLQQLIERVLVLLLQRLERHVVLGQESHRRRVDERGGGAWLHQRHGHAERLVHAAQLRQIRQLVGTGDVADRGEQGVLDQRAQQDVRAEGLRVRARARHHLGVRDAYVSSHEV